MSEEELTGVADWVIENRYINSAAAAYWTLLNAHTAIAQVNDIEDSEFAALLVKAGDRDFEMSDEDNHCGNAMEALIEAWFDAREALGQRCLAAMRLLANVALTRRP